MPGYIGDIEGKVYLEDYGMLGGDMFKKIFMGTQPMLGVNLCHCLY